MTKCPERIIDKQLKMLRERRKELGESYASHITAAADCRRQQKAIDKEFYAMAAKESAP